MHVLYVNTIHKLLLMIMDIFRALALRRITGGAKK